MTIYANAHDVLRSDNKDVFLAWARRHGIDPEATWSVRVVPPLVRVVEYELNAEGQRFIRGGQPARRARWTWLRSWPPRLVRGGAS